MSTAPLPPPHDRFSPLGESYAKFRPTYPREIFDWLANLIDLSPGREVADIGAGTGLFTQLLLARALRVRAVEPSAPMLEEAIARLSGYDGFTAVVGTAEQTNLPATSVDAIFCAQAFHWFNHEAAVAEWHRILRPRGSAVLVWNNIDQSDLFGRRLADLMKRYAVDGGRTIALALEVQAENVLFGKSASARKIFSNRQFMDYAGFVGRTESVSYAPKPGDPRFTAMIDELRALFEQCQSDGQVTLHYKTVALVGPVPAP